MKNTRVWELPNPCTISFLQKRAPSPLQKSIDSLLMPVLNQRMAHTRHQYFIAVVAYLEQCRMGLWFLQRQLRQLYRQNKTGTRCKKSSQQAWDTREWTGELCPDSQCIRTSSSRHPQSGQHHWHQQFGERQVCNVYPYHSRRQGGKDVFEEIKG